MSLYFVCKYKIGIFFKMIRFKSADILVQVTVEPNVKLPRMSKKKVREKSQKMKRKRQNNRETKTMGGMKNVLSKQRNKRQARRRMENDECFLVVQLLLVWNSFYSVNIWKLHMWVNFIWKETKRLMLTLSSLEGMLCVLNTHWRRKLFMLDCDAPFCYYSIIEGHSFTITVGLWVSADIMNTVALWPVAGKRRQEFLAYSSIFRVFSAFFFSPFFWYIDLQNVFSSSRNFVNTLQCIVSDTTEYLAHKMHILNHKSSTDSYLDG